MTTMKVTNKTSGGMVLAGGGRQLMLNLGKRTRRRRLDATPGQLEQRFGTRTRTPLLDRINNELVRFEH